MQYTELESSTEIQGLDELYTKLDALKHLPPPPEDDDHDDDDVRLAMDSYERLKTEYLLTIDRLYQAQSKFKSLLESVDTMKGLVEKLSSTGRYTEELTCLIEQFQKDEEVDALKLDMTALTKKFYTLRRVLKISDLGERYLCFTCLQRPVDTFLHPCGHVICESCIPRLHARICPFCRADVTMCKMFLG